MKTISNLFLTIALITSCSAQKLNNKKIVGKYQSKKGNTFTELVLSADNTFNYKQVAGLYNSKSEGTWELKDKNIVLMSNVAFKTDMIEVFEVDSQKEREITIIDESGKPCFGAVVKIKNIKGDVTKKTDNGGVITLESDTSIKSFEVYYLGENYSYYALKDNSSFDIVLYTDNLDKKYFDNAKVIIKKNSLMLEDIKLLQLSSLPR
ncbi:hypothetical protein [Aquimarina pacifica]|uniref:hypothetical protein n=1 Tax=Aquimarina pacifica TaxID=1296415 RepID=UPI000471658A|nr:hypothetical protein [Aquimarina pacifica]